MVARVAVKDKWYQGQMVQGVGELPMFKLPTFPMFKLPTLLLRGGAPHVCCPHCFFAGDTRTNLIAVSHKRQPTIVVNSGSPLQQALQDTVT